MTTSEEGKKLKNVEPHWQPDGLLNIASERYAKRKETLADVLLLAERLSADNPSDAAAVERLIELVEHGRRLAVSLLTACKATQTQQAKNSRVPAERTDLLHATERLEALAERARNWGRVFPKDLEGRPAGEWLEFEEAAQSRVILRPTEADRRIEEPLGALYTHLKSSMKIMVQMPDGTHPTVMSCSSAESYLKNSTDTATRRQVFGAYNAWFAENAAPFAALLNAMTGHRLNLSDRAGMSMLDASLKSERMSRPAFDAMMRAVRAAAPRARNAVQLSGMVLSCLEGRRSGLSVANLFAPLPEAAPLEAAASFDGATDALRRTFSRIDPDFQGFLKRLLSAGWIETSNISGGEGGTWCAQVPACSAVAVYADYQPTLNRACELAHILGEASLRDRLIAYPAIAQNPSLLSCEIAGRFFMDAFLAQLLEETEWERREHAAVLWQALRQIGVNLLHLPFRFELSHRLHEERRHGYLSVNDINKLTNTIWEDYFADTVRGSDPYVWAAKLHFYLPREPHYDWQYTAGYLIAAVLRRRLLADGCTACGGSFGDFLSDCATIDCDELIRRHLGADPASDAFWTDAATEALNVMRDADRHIQSFIS